METSNFFEFKEVTLNSGKNLLIKIHIQPMFINENCWCDTFFLISVDSQMWKQ